MKGPETVYLTCSGIEKADGTLLTVEISLPITDGTGSYCVVTVEGAIDGKKIFADDAISAIINAFTYVRDVLDEPIPSVAEKLGHNLYVLDTIHVALKP